MLNISIAGVEKFSPPSNTFKVIGPYNPPSVGVHVNKKFEKSMAIPSGALINWNVKLSSSGSTISIISSVHFKSKTLAFSDISATHYHFSTFDEADLDAYLQSGLWEGKAGACMVEGFCKQYIQSVNGYESTAMGLQVESILPWIKG